jgi:hypothetical protein
MIARFKIAPGGPRSLSARGQHWSVDRIYTTSDPGLIAWLQRHHAFNVLSVEGAPEPEPAPEPAKEERGVPVDGSEHFPELEMKPKTRVKKTARAKRKSSAKKKRTRKA